MASPGPSPKRHKSQSETNERRFCIETLLHLLYGKKTIEPVDLTKLKKSTSYYHVDRHENGHLSHDPSTKQEDQSFSYAIKSFPPEVQLCTSSIPGARYGVCAKRTIPEGTWIGPYEGKRVKPEDLSQNLDNSYIWEVYENGQTSCYIDGSDESTSSWMRYIRCARSKTEQNLYAFQYLDNVFYRSFKEISPGTEMLVWYDDKYPQFMGIPMGLQEIEFVNANDIGQNRRLFSREQGNEPFQKNQDLSIPQRNLRDQSVPPSQRLTASSHASHVSEASRTTQHISTVTTSQDNYIHSTVPASAYGKSQSHVPVNISAGIPSQAITGRASGRAHSGITGVHNPVVKVQTLEEGTIHFERGEVPSPPDRDNVTSSSMSVNTEWMSRESDKLYPQAPASVYSRPSYHPSDLSNQPGMASKLPSYQPSNLSNQPGTASKLPSYQPSNLSNQPGMASKLPSYQPSDLSNQPGTVSKLPSYQPSNLSNQPGTASKLPSHQPSDLSNQPGTASKLPSTDTDVSRAAKPSSDGRRRGWRLSYLPYKEVTEEDLRERGYLVKDDSPRRPKSTRPRHTPPRMGVYVWKDEDVFFDQNPESAKVFEEIKVTESDSNSSNSSKESNSDGKELLESNIDEISMWRCRQCQKTFTQRVQLQIHVCPNEPFKPYRCGQCEMSFDTATELRSHVDTHASEKPFKCGFCSRSFAGATTLNNHIRTHMGKRPFTCECGKSFAQAGQLARHQRNPEECEHNRSIS